MIIKSCTDGRIGKDTLIMFVSNSKGNNYQSEETAHKMEEHL
jgi:hypothetical protein